MFSNVQPKRSIKMQGREPKFCPKCEKNVPRYWVNCPTCGRELGGFHDGDG